MTNQQNERDTVLEPEILETKTVTETEVTAQEEKPKRSKGKRVVLIILLVLLALLLLAGGIVGWMYWQGQRDLLNSQPPVITPPEELVDIDDENRVVYQGVTYEYNPNVTAILVVGVDKEDIQEESVYGQNGQADTLFLATLDTKTGDIHLIPLSRETMVDVDKYAVDGSYLGVEKTQLCLAYAYGSNGAEGCENVVRSVSRLLYGVPINSYVAIDMDGIEAITDTIGGITVTALEDIPHPWKDYLVAQKGKKVTLDGKTAIYYLRHRDTDAQANVRRMKRFRQFFSTFLSVAGNNLKNDIGLLPKYYNVASPYLVSDLSLSKITYLVGNTLSGNNWQDPTYHTISGESVDGGDHNQFHADTASVYEAVLAAFYTPVEGESTTESTNTTAQTDAE